MTSSRPVGDIREAIAARHFPTAMMWDRLEARPRTNSLDRALRAEVRDPLWMLTKQWQMGEFRGSDAGSPVFAKLQMDTTRLTKYRPGDAAATQPFEDDVPLEATVERRGIPLTTGGRPASPGPADDHGQAVARHDQRHRRLPAGVHPGLPRPGGRPGQRPGRRPLRPA